MKTVFERDCSSKIWSKSHRRVLPDLFKVRIPLSLVSVEFVSREMVRVTLFCQFVHLYALLFCPANSELRFTIYWISEKSIESYTLSMLYIDPIHRVLVSFPPLLLVPCKTWFGQSKLVRIFVFLVHGIYSRKEYCLSFPA